MNPKESGFVNIFLSIIVFILLLVIFAFVILLVILRQQNTNIEMIAKDTKDIDQTKVSPTPTNSTIEQNNIPVSKSKFAEILQKVAFNMSSLDSVNVDFTRKNLSRLEVYTPWVKENINIKLNNLLSESLSEIIYSYSMTQFNADEEKIKDRYIIKSKNGVTYEDKLSGQIIQNFDKQDGFSTLEQDILYITHFALWHKNVEDKFKDLSVVSNFLNILDRDNDKLIKINDNINCFNNPKSKCELYELVESNGDKFVYSIIKQKNLMDKYEILFSKETGGYDVIVSYNFSHDNLL